MFADLTDEQLIALHQLFTEESDRNHHESGRVSEEDAKALGEMYTGASEEALKRRRLPGGYEKFWWAR